MLVLSRTPGEKILFPGTGASVEVVAVKSGVVRLGIEAPPEVVVLREELQPEAARAATFVADASERRHQLRNRLNGAVLCVALLRRQQKLGLAQEAEAALGKIELAVEEISRHLEQEQRGGTVRPASKPVRTRKALLVEDDHNERELLAGLLRLAGLDVDLASDGLEALECLRQRGRPDVVLTDMMLPRCDGPTMIRALRQDPAFSGLPIFGLTGHEPERFGLDSGPAGVNRWFRKPINPEALLHNLEYAPEDAA